MPCWPCTMISGLQCSSTWVLPMRSIITLGLPINFATSVDHGTALDLAGSGKAMSQFCEVRAGKPPSA